MYRGSIAEKGVFFFPLLLVAISLIGFTYYRLEKAKKDLADYWIAKSCPNNQNCRQKVEVVILQGEEKSLTVNIITKSGWTNSNKKTLYHILLSLDSQTHEIKISPNPPSNGTPFDIPNVRIPSGLDLYFIEGNFHKGEPAYVEIWRGIITILYLDTISDVPASVFQPTPLPGTQPIITNRDLPKTYEIALPTIAHPIFHQASTEYDFSSTVVVCSFVMTILTMVLYNEDINRAWKRIFNKKENKSLLRVRQNDFKIDR